jgi:hypothetical protein
MAGKNCKAFLNTGTFTTKTFLEGKRISGVKLPKSRGSSDFKMRGNSGTVTALGYNQRSATFRYELKAPGATDSFFTALQAADEAGTDIEIYFMRGPMTTGMKGIGGFWVVTKFDKDEADEENEFYDVELKPADHEESGTTVEVGLYTAT